MQWFPTGGMHTPRDTQDVAKGYSREIRIFKKPKEKRKKR